MEKKRDKVSFDEVAGVVASMTETGERPTLRAIREKVGGGSLGTIQRYLTQINEAKVPTAAAPIPSPEIQKALAQELQSQLTLATGELRSELTAKTTDIELLSNENERLSALIEEQLQEIELLKAINNQKTGQIEQLTSELDARKSETKALRSELDGERSRLQATQQDVALLTQKNEGLDAKVAEFIKREATQQARIHEADQSLLVIKDELRVSEFRVKTLERASQEERSNSEKSLQLEKATARSEEREKWMSEVETVRRDFSRVEREAMERERSLQTRIFELESELRRKISSDPIRP